MPAEIEEAIERRRSESHDPSPPAMRIIWVARHR